SRGRSSRLHYPPSSFLSPYTTLFRSPTRGVPYKIYARTLAHGGESFTRFMALSVPARMGRFLAVTGGVAALGKLADRRGLSKKRSEEHTSELQSRFDIVCRLLLEKTN